MKILIYFFTDKDTQGWIDYDYIQFPFKICFIFYLEEHQNKFLDYLKDLKRKLDFETMEFIDFFSRLKNMEKSVEAIVNEFDKKDILFTIYTKKCSSVYHEDDFKNTVIYNFKILIKKLLKLEEIEGIKSFIETTVDLTDCSTLASNLIYYLTLENRLIEKFNSFKILIRDNYTKKPSFLPKSVLSTTTQIFLDLIANGNCTIKDLQNEYSKKYRDGKIVSQPFISRYVSKLISYDLIQEERKEGFKYFSLKNNAKIYTTPSLKEFEKTYEDHIENPN